MTHSHDTSTPAMSDETVPSEEFVLVPREPTRETFVAMTWGFNVYGGLPGAYRAMIENFAALPQPSPALAKGGDAVRERIARALNGVLGSEEDEHPRHHPAQNSSEKPTEVWWTQWLEAADAVIAALSTPTEGPASQTEGMGRDATKLRENIEAFLEMHRRGVLTPRTPNIPIELLQKALAALTQPETAEAVPPLYLIRKGGAFYRPNSQGYTRSIAEAGRYSLAEAEAITHPNGPNGPRDGMDYIPAPALASDPAPAGEAVEPLEDRIDNAVQAMSETHHSWESRCHAIMAALGFNFGWSDPKSDEEPASEDTARLREDLERRIAVLEKLYGDASQHAYDQEQLVSSLERERDDARKALETATDARERLVEAVSTFLGKGEHRDAVSCNYCGDTHGGNRCRSGGDHDFDPTGERIWEFEGKDVDALRAALATEASR